MSGFLYASIFLAVIFVIAGGVARAQSQASPKLIDTFGAWAAFSADSGDGKMCFAASQPVRSSYEPNDVRSRDPAYFMITTVPGSRTVNEVSTLIGYPFSEGSMVTVNVDGSEFALFTEGSGAWIADLARERALVDAIRHGAKMSVRGKSRRGTATTDVYSLSGSKAALDAAAQACPTG